MGTQVGQGYGAAANATGQGVAQIGNQTTATSSNALSAPSQMLNAGLSGYGTSANIANQTFGNQLAAYNAGQAGSNSMMSGIGTLAGVAAGIMLAADGGAIPGRYANGGPASVPVSSGVTPVMASSGMAEQGDSGNGTGGLLSGLAGGLGAGFGLGGNSSQQQATQLIPQTQAIIQNDPQMQQLQYGTFALPQGTNASLSSPSGPGGMPISVPGQADGGPAGAVPGRHPDYNESGQRKRYDYGNPAVQHDQQPMAPPLVNIPGPWVGANGGPPQHPPGMIQHGPTDGTGIDDQVHARVSVGEYIIPADVVHAKGKEFFDQLLKRYHVPAQQQRQQMGAMH